MSNLILQLTPTDNVAVALQPLPAGTRINTLTTTTEIPQGHKLALTPIPANEPIIKYGYPIAIASEPISPGDHVHTHNLKSSLPGHLEQLHFDNIAKPTPPPPTTPPKTFQGIRRPNGNVATRNEIWIVNTVGCVNHASARIAERANRELSNSRIDGVYHFPHPFGCSQLGDDLHNTQKVLAGLVNHPNAAAVLILGLGCENNQMADFLAQLSPADKERIRYFNAQDVTDEVEQGVEAVYDLAAYASTFTREEIPLCELIVGMKCGGSDGFSGITANPLVGRVADLLTAAGATVLLTEVPEMFGAERVLLEKAATPAVFSDTIQMVNNFRDYFRRYNQPIDENPSPGNKAGGISTLAEKSLGCVQKAGHSPIREVLPYGARATPRLAGVSLINAPGNDGVSSTAMTVAGAHLLLFTTGRGTPMGFPATTLKISSNSDLAKRKPQWIDFDAGPIAAGASIDDLADQLLTQILQTASNLQKSRSEQNNYREIAIWKDGVTL